MDNPADNPTTTSRDLLETLKISIEAIKVKESGPELCPFSGSGRNSDIPTRICSRTPDGSKGNCDTCRVAAEWEECYG